MKPLPTVPASGPSPPNDNLSYDRFGLDSTAKSVYDETLEDGVPHWSEVQEDGIAKRARTRPAAATSPPFDPQKRISDRIAEADLILAYGDEEALIDKKDASAKKVTERHGELAETTCPAPWSHWGARAAFVIGLSIIGIRSVGSILAPNLDIYVFRYYVLRTFSGATPPAAYIFAEERAFLFIAVLMMALAGLVIFNHRTIPRSTRPLIALAIEIEYPASFLSLRLDSPHFSWSLLGVSGIEMVVLSVILLVLFGLAPWFRENAEVRATYRLKKARLDAAQEEHEKDVTALAAAQGKIATAHDALKKREWDEAMLPIRQDLEEIESRIPYRRATARIITEFLEALGMAPPRRLDGPPVASSAPRVTTAPPTTTGGTDETAPGK